MLADDLALQLVQHLPRVDVGVSLGKFSPGKFTRFTKSFSDLVRAAKVADHVGRDNIKAVGKVVGERVGYGGLAVVDYGFFGYDWLLFWLAHIP